MEGQPTTQPAVDGRRLRGERSRARIRRAARDLFRERGFDGATLRAIAERAGMGASSIYRHVSTKHELLVLELSELQEEAWLRFRQIDDREQPTLLRLRRFLEMQHTLLAGDADLTVIALRATTYPDAPVALALDADVLSSARAIFHITSGARISWANGLLSERACRKSIETSVELLFRGIARPVADS
jgi:AcrR family transcriptional regulator